MDRDTRASAAGGQTVRVWDLDSGEPVLGPLTGHDGEVWAVAVGQRHGSPVIVSGGTDQTVQVRDLESERHITLRIGLQHQVRSVAAAGNQLVIGTTAELLRVDLL
jgi:WD40 repeat protein